MASILVNSDKELEGIVEDDDPEEALQDNQIRQKVLNYNSSKVKHAQFAMAIMSIASMLFTTVSYNQEFKEDYDNIELKANLWFNMTLTVFLFIMSQITKNDKIQSFIAIEKKARFFLNFLLTTPKNLVP